MSTSFQKSSTRRRVKVSLVFLTSARSGSKRNGEAQVKNPRCLNPNRKISPQYLPDSLMGFFDLSIPYSHRPSSGGKEVFAGEKSRVKLATKAMELGYVGIAHNRSIEGVMSNKDCCTIPLLTLGSLVKAAPRLASSVGFHRDLLGVDIISIDFDKMPFRLNHSMVKSAIKRGIYFEIKYSDLLKDALKRRQVISNAKLLVDWTKGKNVIISSGASSVAEVKGASSVAELRGPNDVVNLMSLLGLSTDRARAAISKNCGNMIAKVLKKKRFHKEAVKVESLSSSEAFSLEKPLSGDCMKWDPLSSDEGDMLLDDIAKAFDATRAVAQKPSKAIDFTSVLKGLPSHGFRIKDVVGAEPLIQPPAAKTIDASVQSNNQVSEVCMADSASSDDNLRGNETISQINMVISDNKVEPRTMAPLRKCSTSRGQGFLVQDQAAAASLTLRRCTNSDVASDVSMKTDAASDVSVKTDAASDVNLKTDAASDVNMKTDAASDVNMKTELDSEDKSMPPSKRGHWIPQSPVENLNMETIVVDDKVSRDSNEGAISGHANTEHSASIDGDDDEMKINDGSSEANHDEYMEVEVEDQKHETGDSNINLPNLSSETSDLLRESGNSLSPEAVGQDQEQVSRLESIEAELGEEPPVPYHSISETTMEDKKESVVETETNVQSSERNNATNSGKGIPKRSRVRLAQLGPYKPFLLHSRFKRISKRGKHRRRA
ncbi:unnamed protein product [Thlaspi arvense]|uniref:Uncharacterized protein n=1 Tax=Thlaspi arvense TaxID=13288 RepID=A0AAU9SLD1_THLAR|nr:unnamed protein product [Thlaspi arvense]